jgi:lipopolysaccharide export system protein LptA
MSGKRNSGAYPPGGRPTAMARASLVALLVGAAAFLPGETFNFSGDSTTMTLAEGGQHALLTGHGRVESQDMRITADSIELFGKDFIYAQCHGNVRVVDARRGLDLTSQDLFYDRDRKIARVRGNATMADVKNEMVVKGGFIEDRDTEQITIVQIGVRIFKKDIICRSEFARYQRDKKILELSGTPWVSKGGDVYQAARITINLDTEEITLEGSVQGTLEDKGKSTTEPGAAGAATAPAPASPPGPAAATGPGIAPSPNPAPKEKYNDR